MDCFKFNRKIEKDKSASFWYDVGTVKSCECFKFELSKPQNKTGFVCSANVSLKICHQQVSHIV